MTDAERIAALEEKIRELEARILPLLNIEIAGGTGQVIYGAHNIQIVLPAPQ
ncbi:MAG: hypothetical protein Q8M02_13115 [Candidatus Didemnitutus sp.]|nr:hypothetical protein [Candidatus Didemnitutus sp.]